jgi:hypothetical protein
MLVAAQTTSQTGEKKMADPTIFEYQIQDDGGLKNRSSIYVAYDGATETVDALIGAWSAYGGLIDPCVDGQILGGQITIPLVPNVAWKAAPAQGNNANQIMSLGFDNDFNSYVTSVLLPSYKEVLLTPTLTPDLTDPALAALIAAVIAGSGAVFPNSRDLHDLNALRDAFLSVRKVRGQRVKTRVIG